MKDERLRVGIDVDGVVADFISLYRRICSLIVSHDISADPANWGMSNWGMTKEEHKRAWAIVGNTTNLYTHIPPYRCEAARNLGSLEKDFRLYFITTRQPTKGQSIEWQTAFWLRSYCKVRFPTVLVEDNKGPIIKALKLDAFIDDRPENLQQVAEHSPDTDLFLMRRSWNGDSDQKIEGYYTIVDQFQEFIDSLYRVKSFRQEPYAFAV